MFSIPEIEGKVTYPAIAGIRGRGTPMSHPLCNIIGTEPGTWVLSPEQVAAVVAWFRERGTAFGWLVTPSSPPDTETLLKAQGLAPLITLEGLVKHPLEVGEMPAGVRVEESALEDHHDWARLYARAYGEPEEMIQFMTGLLHFNPNPIHRFRNYVAFVDGVDEPVACASTMFFADHPVIYLGGAATLAEHRGKGAYRALVHRRFVDAAAEGCEAAVIQAVSDTSAPICSALGFTRICQQLLYAWQPDSEA